QDLFDYAYPYPKYEQAFVPEYNLGAMENPGLVTFTESYIYVSGATESQLESRANVICHEMSHMWFGDLVTMKWWDDLWLKESFADFMGTLGAKEANGFEDAWVTFANQRKAWAYRQDQMPTTHPIVADIPHLEAARQNFDGITYAKGASALKQLVAYVGFDQFIESARVYFKRFAWGNTTLEDFLGVLDEVSDRDVRLWASAWLQTSGLSELSTERVRDDTGLLTQLRLTQELPVGVPETLGRPHQLKLATFTLDDNKLVETTVLPVEVPAGMPTFEVELTDAQRDHVSQADLLLLNAEDLTYAKINISEGDGRALALSHVSTIADALSRGVVWVSLWGQVRDGKLPASAFVQAVGNAASQESSATLLSNLMNQAQSAISLYAPQAQREELWDSLYLALYEALAQTEAGSDSQLILLRALLAISAHSKLGLELAQDVARGAYQTIAGDITEVPGIRYNQTLGWKALCALAVQDAVPQELLNQARAHKSSATAERGFAFATAALPTAVAKQAAFTAVTTDKNLSNDLLSATASGFQHGPENLRTSYRDTYFDLLLPTWQHRSIGMASRIIQGLYPTVDIAELTGQGHPVVLATEAWLAANQSAPTALRRLLAELLDDALRILNAQSAAL
ncbi:MAG: M1 family aminopeptidase, partial [Rothia sp. (in: high G+C Gram-positive bacteria)]|nr:M1 family aminopeptidase [Rothia sp. (in: high G+C Gram-positive bacteria)]